MVGQDGHRRLRGATPLAGAMAARAGLAQPPAWLNRLVMQPPSSAAGQGAAGPRSPRVMRWGITVTDGTPRRDERMKFRQAVALAALSALCACALWDQNTFQPVPP